MDDDFRPSKLKHNSTGEDDFRPSRSTLHLPDRSHTNVPNPSILNGAETTMESRQGFANNPAQQPPTRKAVGKSQINGSDGIPGVHSRNATVRDPDQASAESSTAQNQPVNYIGNMQLSQATLESISALAPEQRKTLLQFLNIPGTEAYDADKYPTASRAVALTDERPSTLIAEDDPRSYCCNVSRANAKNARFANFYCHGCRAIFGETCSCWAGQVAHSRANEGGGHEKINLTVARWVHDTLSNNHSEEEQRARHLLDSASVWFAAGFDQEGIAVFRDSGRYPSLLAERQQVQRRPCFPGLVSMVGETGAGKSSLIKLLISMHAGDSTPKTPVVGSSSSADTPTSGDVHLYSDPKTFLTAEPILYADAEGLHGGTRDPVGATYRKRRSVITDTRRMQTASLRKHLRRKHDASERELVWADTAQKNNRRYFVHALYPRLLYTFSDVVVFVLKNARVIEDVVEQLVTWADAVLEASSNQPVLPHAIIVLNMSDNADPRLWDVGKSTEALLSSIEQVVQTNETLRKFVESWQHRGVKLESAGSLLLSYYSTVRVVRVPEKNQTSLMYQQIQTLYREIAEATKQSLESKSNTRMKLSSEEMQPYLQSAFDHFAATLDRPFDFVRASYAKSNLPSDFSGNILTLAINSIEPGRPLIDGQILFKELSFMLASCTMIDTIRKRFLGGATPTVMHYLTHFDEALEDFADKHWQCEYVHQGGRCVNVRAGHSKGHQIWDGQIIGTGPFIS